MSDANVCTSFTMFPLPGLGSRPCLASAQREVRDISVRMKFELQPLGRAFAEVCLRIGTEASLDCARQPKIEQIIRVQMRELAA